MKVHASRRTLLLTATALAFGLAVAQPGDRYVQPRTPWGDPDIQGVFNTATITPFERPAEFAGREFLTPAEARQLERQSAARRIDAPPDEGDVGTYNQFWFEPGTKVVSTLRTSLIIDPPDGRIPLLKEAAQANLASLRDAVGYRGTDGPDNRPLTERCLWWASTGPPIIPTGYNNNYRIAQSPGYVMIVNEMIHDARIVPLDGRPHLPKAVAQWLGDSRGRWDGNTLIVETTNFNDWTRTEFGRPPFGSVRGISEDSRLIERFTRTSEEILMYEFTIDDPDTYERPWTAQVSWRRTDGPIYEYACHEGNYGLRNVLSGERQAERAKENDQARQ